MAIGHTSKSLSNERIDTVTDLRSRITSLPKICRNRSHSTREGTIKGRAEGEQRNSSPPLSLPLSTQCSLVFIPEGQNSSCQTKCRPLGSWVAWCTAGIRTMFGTHLHSCRSPCQRPQRRPIHPGYACPFATHKQRRPGPPNVIGWSGARTAKSVRVLACLPLRKR